MAKATDTGYRFGIEEEFFLADAATRGTPDGDAARAFHKAVAEKIKGAGRENLQSQVEIQTSRLPSFSDRSESIGKHWKFGEHGGEPLDQRQQAVLGHGGDEFVEHAALPR